MSAVTAPAGKQLIDAWTISSTLTYIIADKPIPVALLVAPAVPLAAAAPLENPAAPLDDVGGTPLG